MHLRHLSVLVGLSFAATAASSADWGVAVGVDNNSQTLYAPIQIQPGWRAEPYFGHHKTEKTNSDPTAFFDRKDAYSGWTLGAGVFAVRPASAQINLLGGLRMAYLKSTQDNGEAGGTKLKGYLLAPAVGFEYFFDKHIAVGAEAAFNLSWSTETRQTYYSSDTEAKRRERGTSSLVTLKYFFN